MNVVICFFGLVLIIWGLARNERLQWPADYALLALGFFCVVLGLSLTRWNRNIRQIFQKRK